LSSGERTSLPSVEVYDEILVANSTEDTLMTLCAEFLRQSRQVESAKTRREREREGKRDEEEDARKITQSENTFGM